MVKKNKNKPEPSPTSSDEELLQHLGFSSFSTTKNKDHSLTSVEYISQVKPKRKFNVGLNRKSTRYKQA